MVGFGGRQQTGAAGTVRTWGIGLEVLPLVFACVLQAGDDDDNGISIESDALMLSGAVITDVSKCSIESTGLGVHAIPLCCDHCCGPIAETPLLRSSGYRV